MNSYLAAVELLPLAKELDEDKVTPGLLGFIVFAVLALAVWQLLKSMNRHMKRVDFEEQQERADEAAEAAEAAQAPRDSGPQAG